MSSRWARIEMTGWGRVNRSAGEAARPERGREIGQLLEEAADTTLIARGAGRSYGDASLNSGGRSMLCTRLDRLLDFDPDTGDLIAEPGVTFGDLVRCFVPRGFIPPVVPGTGYATLGGGVANDVHGKNHHVLGSLGDHLRWIELRLPNGELRRVDATPNCSLYRATVGGVGLTGVMERICVRMVRTPSNAVAVTRYRVPDLEGFLSAFETHREKDHYVVGWIDALARGEKMGRGILEAATAAGQPVDEKSPRNVTVPMDFPAWALNASTVKLFNTLYNRFAGSPLEAKPMPYGRFLFPLDTLLEWNRIYGRRGFRQFQCVVPFEGGDLALQQMLELISASGRGSFLAVIKALGKAGPGYLSFAMPGYTLALDFPNHVGLENLIHRLETITADFGGRVYLAKDSTLNPEMLAAMYPELDSYRGVLREIDPGGRMRSDLAVRLGLLGA